MMYWYEKQSRGGPNTYYLLEILYDILSTWQIYMQIRPFALRFFLNCIHMSPSPLTSGVSPEWKIKLHYDSVLLQVTRCELCRSTRYICWYCNPVLKQEKIKQCRKCYACFRYLLTKVRFSKCDALTYAVCQLRDSYIMVNLTWQEKS